MRPAVGVTTITECIVSRAGKNHVASRISVSLLAIGLWAAPPLALNATDLQAFANQWSVKLTTIGRSSGQPRTVTVWFVYDGGHVYLQAGKEGHTDWYRNLRKHPEVTLDFGALTARGSAQTVDDPREVDRVHGLFRQKYLTARISGWLGGSFGSGKVVLVEALEDAGPRRSATPPDAVPAASP